MRDLDHGAKIGVVQDGRAAALANLLSAFLTAINAAWKAAALIEKITNGAANSFGKPGYTAIAAMVASVVFLRSLESP